MSDETDEDQRVGDAPPTRGEGQEALSSVDLPDLTGMGLGEGGDNVGSRTVGELKTIFDVPVKVTAVLGRKRLSLDEIIALEPGKILALDRKVGEPIDIYVNDRLVARGEIVLIGKRLGITMTELIENQ